MHKVYDLSRITVVNPPSQISSDDPYGKAICCLTRSWFADKRKAAIQAVGCEYGKLRPTE